MPSSPTPPPTDRTALAVAAFGSALGVVVAVQAPALVPALGVGLAVWCTSSCGCDPHVRGPRPGSGSAKVRGVLRQVAVPDSGRAPCS
jgi:hypothetical protein